MTEVSVCVGVEDDSVCEQVYEGRVKKSAKQRFRKKYRNGRTTRDGVEYLLFWLVCSIAGAVCEEWSQTKIFNTCYKNGKST